MANLYVIALDVTLQSPLHITDMIKGRFDAKRAELSRNPNDKFGVECSLTRTTSLAQFTEERRGALVAPIVPVIPSSTIAGKLRRSATDLIAHSLVKRSLTISPNAYNVMTTGMATTNLDSSSKTPEVLQVARNDAFLSLFGGTSFALDSHCVIADGLPLLESTKGMLMSPVLTSVQPFGAIEQMTDVIAIIKKNDVLDQRGAYIERVIGLEQLINYSEAANADAASSKARKVAAAAGEEVESKKTSIRTFNAFEAVKAGVSFGIRVGVTSFDPSQLGLMLLALQNFLRDGQVGGKGAKGYGRFALSGSALYEVDPTTRTLTAVSSIFEDKISGYGFKEAQVIDDAVIAAQDYVDAVEPALIEAFTNTDAKAIKQSQKKGWGVAAEEDATA